MISVSSTSRVLGLSGCLIALASTQAVGCSSSNDGLAPGDGDSSGGNFAMTSTGTTSNSSSRATSMSGSGGGASSSSTAGPSKGAGGSFNDSASTGSASGSGAGGAAESSSSAGAGDPGSAVATGAGGGVPSGFDQFQERNLADVNQYRATLNLAPLVLDKTLSTFALAGSSELTMDHMPHQHFVAAGNAIWSEGFVSQAGENQGDPHGWLTLSSDPVQNELDQIDDIQKQMYDEGPGTGEAHGHYENMMSTKFTRLGVGLIEVGTSLYLTNDFSN